jgi:hypothetical protein
MGGWFRYSYFACRWVSGPESLSPEIGKPQGSAGWVWCSKTPTLKPTGDAAFSNTFRLLDRGACIACLRCGRESHNADDVRQKYCGNCGYYE